MSLAGQNKALVRRFYEEIDKGNIQALDELVGEDYLDHNPPPFPGLATGREGLKQAFKIFWDATPGFHKIEDQIAEDDKVVTRMTSFGRHEGDLPGAPPSPFTASPMANWWRSGPRRTSSDFCSRSAPCRKAVGEKTAHSCTPHPPPPSFSTMR